MSEQITLEPVDRVEVITLYENLVDQMAPGVVDTLVAMEPAVIAPAHCTGYRAAYAVYQQRPEAFVQNTVGTRIVLGAE